MKSFAQLKGIDRALALARSEIRLVDAIIEGVIEMEMPNRLVNLDFKRIITACRKQDLGLVETSKMLMREKEIWKEIQKTAMIVAEGSKWDHDIQPIMEEN